VRQALEDLGIDDAVAAKIGLRLYKVGMVWPLEAEGVRHFAEGLEEILVIEEKRQFLEYQLKEELYNWSDRRDRASSASSTRKGNGRCRTRNGCCPRPAS
jgi:indolepyruvate ferredoxin oxidoreductase